MIVITMSFNSTNPTRAYPSLNHHRDVPASLSPGGKTIVVHVVEGRAGVFSVFKKFARAKACSLPVIDEE